MKEEKISIRIGKKQKEMLQSIAKLNNVSVSSIINNIITDWLTFLEQSVELEEAHEKK